MTKRARLAMTALALSGLIGAGTGQAVADVPEFKQFRGSGVEDCPSDRYCLYNEPEFNDEATNYMWQARTTQPNLGRSPGGGDAAESVVNRTDDPVTVYEHFHTGRCLTVEPHSVVRDLDYFGLRNKVSSVHKGSEYKCPRAGTVAK